MVAQCPVIMQKIKSLQERIYYLKTSSEMSCAKLLSRYYKEGRKINDEPVYPASLNYFCIKRIELVS